MYSFLVDVQDKRRNPTSAIPVDMDRSLTIVARYSEEPTDPLPFRINPDALSLDYIEIAYGPKAFLASPSLLAVFQQAGVPISLFSTHLLDEKTSQHLSDNYQG